MKRRRSFIVIVVALLVILVGCTQKSQPEDLRVAVPYFSDDTYTVRYQTFTRPDMSWTKKAKPLKKAEDAVNELCADVCDYVNGEWGTSWKSDPIEVYTASVSENLGDSMQYGACYYQGRIYLDQSESKSIEKNMQTRYIVAHELLHYLYEQNAKDSPEDVFALEEAGCYCGFYLEEAFVDSIARRYMIARCAGIDTAKLSSAYKYIRMYVDLLQLAVPDAFQYFLENDIEGLRESVNQLASQHLVCVGDCFEKWASMLCESLWDSNEVISDRVSMVVSMLIVITPSEKAGKFVSRTAELNLGLTVNQIQENMY